MWIVRGEVLVVHIEVVLTPSFSLYTTCEERAVREFADL